MSDIKNFDNYFKEQFTNIEAEVPSSVWDNIVAERERRRPVGFWGGLLSNKNIAIIAASVIAASTALWTLSDKNNSGNIGFKIADERVKTNPPQQKNVNTISKTTKNIPGNNSDKSALISSTSVDNSKSSSANTVNLNSFNNNAVENKELNRSSNSMIVWEEDDKVVVDKIPNDNTFIKENNTKKKSKSYNNIITADKNDTAYITGNELNIVTDGSLLNRLLYGAEKIRLSDPVANLSLKPRAFPNVAFPDCPIMEKDIAGNKRYFEIYAGPDYGIRTFTDTPNSTYLQKRSESTKFSFAYSAGLRYTRVFKNAMSVRAGVNYSQINERFTFIQSNVTQVTYIIDPVTGDTTGQYTVSGSRYRTTYNRYRNVDIPLLVGYEIGNGRFHANINAGAMINLYSWQKGEVLDTLNKPVSITTGSKSPYQYKTNMGVAFTGGISAYYKLTEQMHLLAEPYIRYNLSPMNQEAITLKQKYTTIGLRLGVRFDLQ